MGPSFQYADLPTSKTPAIEASLWDQEQGGGTKHDLHVSAPSLWPLILSAAVSLFVVGLLFVPDNPWLALVAIPLILFGSVGWGLEGPAASPTPTSPAYMPAIMTAEIAYPAQEAIDLADTQGEHPALALYDTVELAAQSGEMNNRDGQSNSTQASSRPTQRKNLRPVRLYPS